MTHFELMESIGQTNIFDYIDITPTSIRNNGFVEGDNVRIRFYVDELEYIRICHPQLMEIGTIIDKQYDFYRVRIGDSIVDVPGEKLVLV